VGGESSENWLESLDGEFGFSIFTDGIQTLIF
jgi:hypothetical protein